jgi:hypothetical protein
LKLRKLLRSILPDAQPFGCRYAFAEWQSLKHSNAQRGFAIAEWQCLNAAMRSGVLLLPNGNA